MLSLKGKLTCQKSTPVREDTIKIPEELIPKNCKIKLCIDIMYVNECRFMTMIDQTIRFRSAKSQSRTARTKNIFEYWPWYWDCIQAQDFHISRPFIATESSKQ
jgi:hypothetical protein